MIAFGTWAGLPEDDRPLLALEYPLPLLLEPDDLLELLACDDPPECDDPLEECEDPDDLLGDDDLDLSAPRDANDASGTRTHRVKPANLTIEFPGCNSI